MKPDKKPFWTALRDGDIKGIDLGRGCFCVGPQEGQTLCPCALREKAFARRLELAAAIRKRTEVGNG